MLLKFQFKINFENINSAQLIFNAKQILLFVNLNHQISLWFYKDMRL